MLSIHKYKPLLVLGLVTLGLGLAPNQAKAVTFTPLTSQDATPGFDDADFNLLLNNGDFKELFVAEGRIGNNGTGGNGERELGINKDVAIGGAPVAQGNFTWGNGKLWDFSLEYDGSKVTYKVLDGNQTISLTSQEFSGPVNQIYLRTFANKGNTSNLQNAVSLTDLVFNGTSVGSLASASTSTSKDVDYLGLSNISSPFTLTGKTALSWVGAAPSRSNLAFQIKVGTSPQSESVPEPGMLGGIFLAATIGAAVSKKKKVAV
ncbi:choice-of-anchor W domain-containing protein [Anabaena sp. PCC 7108]|uniref:choice-of-anchor W domain-containing protein n=1 Tax=Anabaena sp. PCC 7108 TaxID=163908 RepID=UPI000344E66C|nr:choice-of-anchor W domain-containing protein [Anabaena sp. PCC 7108]